MYLCIYLCIYLSIYLFIYLYTYLSIYLSVHPFIVFFTQVFDILPLYGTLQSGETQDIQITFYGHSDITTEVVAACKVHGGPTYQLILAGEASTIEYKIDKKNIKLGSVVCTCMIGE